MVNVYYEYYHALQESAFIDEELGDTNEFGDDTRIGDHIGFIVELPFLWQIMPLEKENQIIILVRLKMLVKATIFIWGVTYRTEWVLVKLRSRKFLRKTVLILNSIGVNLQLLIYYLLFQIQML